MQAITAGIPSIVLLLQINKNPKFYFPVHTKFNWFYLEQFLLKNISIS
jgi:hypothetical protein